MIKKEVLKLLDAGLIYTISDNPSVSPVRCVPKKGGFTVVENEENKLIPTRLVTGWHVFNNYRKLNDTTHKGHFPLLFMDEMLKRLAGNEYHYSLDGFLGYFQIPIDYQDQQRPHSRLLMECLPTVAWLSAYIKSSGGVFTARKPLIFLRLATMDPPGDIIARTTLPKRFGTPRAIISDRGTYFCNDQFVKVLLKYDVAHRENRASWWDKLDDALWAFRTAFKSPIGCTPYKLVYEKACHLSIELEHKAYWALKHANFDLLTAGNHWKVQLNKLNEPCDQAYENSLIYKEKTKRIHDSKIKDRVFNVELLWIFVQEKMSREVLTDGSTIRIRLLYRGEYSQWVERFMNYLEEKTDGEVMIDSIKNDKSMWSDQEKKIQKIDRLVRSLLIQGLPNGIYSLIDSNKTAKDLWDALARHMLGSEYGEQDRKAAVLYEYETFKATEGELLLDTYIRYLQVINDLKKCGYSKDNCELNFKFLNNLQPEWKHYATMMRQNKNLMDINIDALYNILKQNQGDVNDALGLKKKMVVVTSDPLALIAEKTKVSKSKEKVVVSSDSEGSDADDFSELKKITAFKKQEFVKMDDEIVEKKDDEKKRDMSKVKCYNCKREGHFAKDCKKLKVKDYEYYKTKMLLAKKDKDKQVLLAEDQAWMESNRKHIANQEFLYDKMSVQLVELDKHVRDLKNTVLEKDFKISELEECVRNKDLEIEKCLERLNVCKNKLHKMGQTNQTVHMIMPSKDNMYNGKKGIGFKNLSYFCKAKDLRPTLYDEMVINLGYTLMFLTHSDEALEIEKLKRAREIKIKFAYDYGSLNASYRNEKINCSDVYFQEIINPDFDKIDSLFQQTSSLKPYVLTVILEKIIIDLEDEVVSLLEKEKEILKTIESLKSNDDETGVKSSEKVVSETENKSENDFQEIEKVCDRKENLNVIAPRMFKLSVSQSVSPISMSKTSCASEIVEYKTKRKRRKIKSSKQNDKQHMTGNRALLTNFVEKFFGTVRFGNNDFAVIAGYGDVVIRSMTIKKVYYVEGLGHNLFSVGQFCDKGLEVAFRKSTCFVRNEDDQRLLLRNLGCGINVINNLVKNNLVQGLPKMKFKKDHLCSACEQGKIHRKHHKSKTAFTSNKSFYLLHMDLCGPMRIESINGKRYVLVVVDDYSRYTWVFFLHSKDEASNVIIYFIKITQVNLQLQVQRVRTDNGTEFKIKTLAKFFNEVGISQQFSDARTPQQNGIVERRNRTLIEAARTMLTFANLPLCYLLNDYEDVGKLKAKRDIRVFVGYSKESAAFRIYNKQTRKIHERVNVNFDEISEMAFKQFNLELSLSHLNEMGKSSNPSVSETSKKDFGRFISKFL
uniref:Retrovirus-related Pol polyprotein from transposon TNT 1-94 n=1 Tax=Tanacetum cinerariifolium TaxID=118510 RepID=A0A699HK25_TANCI|nr:retrovirus-related Pol polyprotein from transposon TNT 1-94 [Tanacetum cinerariifolium]